MKLSENILEKKSGILINISSISANVPVPFISTYASSKSALENFMI
jgi:short-subunit dehydrogenase